MKNIALLIAAILLGTYILNAPTNLKLLSGAFCTGVCVRLLIDALFKDDE